MTASDEKTTAIDGVATGDDSERCAVANETGDRCVGWRGHEGEHVAMDRNGCLGVHWRDTPPEASGIPGTYCGAPSPEDTHCILRRQHEGPHVAPRGWRSSWERVLVRWEVDPPPADIRGDYVSRMKHAALSAERDRLAADLAEITQAVVQGAPDLAKPGMLTVDVVRLLVSERAAVNARHDQHVRRDTPSPSLASVLAWADRQLVEIGRANDHPTVLHGIGHARRAIERMHRKSHANVADAPAWKPDASDDQIDALATVVANSLRASGTVGAVDGALMVAGLANGVAIILRGMARSAQDLGVMRPCVMEPAPTPPEFAIDVQWPDGDE